MNKRFVSLIFAVIVSALSLIVSAQPKPTWSAKVQTVSATEGVISVTASMPEGWHIYGIAKPGENIQDYYPTVVNVTPGNGMILDGGVNASPAAQKVYDAMMELDLPIYEKKVTFSQKFHVADDTDAAKVAVVVEYMMCNDQSCTPPTKETFDLIFVSGKVKAADADSIAAVVEAENLPVAEPKAPEPQNENIEEQTDDNVDLWAAEEHGEDTAETTDMPWWQIFLLGFGGGILALLTPCVWPMIPMTVSFFLKKSKSRRRAIIDAVTYGLSIIVIFLVLGILITLLFGASKLNELATSAGFNVFFFIILVVFAISFFGAFDIKLPSKWSNAIDSKAENTTGFISIFFMAFTLVLVSFSCTGPIIGTLLVEAASQGSIVGPAIGMGGFALGLALPFGLFAFFPSLLKEMPKSGGWLNSVKVVLGFIELILSLKFLSIVDLAYHWHILDREVFVAIWIVLFVLLGMYLLGKLRFPHDSEQKHTSILGFFLAVASFSMAVYLLPGMWGAPLTGVSAFVPPSETQEFNLHDGANTQMLQTIQAQTAGGGSVQYREFDNYEEGMAYAKEVNRPVMVDFSGYACVNCRKMEGKVFVSPQVQQYLRDHFVMIKLMVDDKTALDKPYKAKENGKEVTISTVGEKWSLLQRVKFGAATQPYYVILNDKGKQMGESRSYDENVKAFLSWLEEGVKLYEESNKK